MTAQSALGRRIEAARRAQDERRERKAAAFKEAFEAETAQVEVVSGVELVLVDGYVLYETYAGKGGVHGGPRYSRSDGNGYDTYEPGKRFILFTRQDEAGNVEADGRRVDDLGDLARLHLRHPGWVERCDFDHDLVLPVLAGIEDLQRELDYLAE